MDAFGFMVCGSPQCAPDDGIIAAARWGAIGVLHCAGVDAAAVERVLAGLRHPAHTSLGVKLAAVGEGPYSKTALPSGTPRLRMHAFGSMS